MNPLQLKRQVEAGCLMGVSIALHEEVTFDEGAVTASDWISYPSLEDGRGARDQGRARPSAGSAGCPCARLVKRAMSA